MKILIDVRTTVREIDQSFRICGFKEDLLKIADQIRRAAQDDFTYGWIDIHAEVIPVKGNNHPRKWEETGEVQFK